MNSVKNLVWFYYYF